MHKLFGLAVILGVVALPIAAQSAELTFAEGVLKLQGPIILGDAERLSTAMAAMSDAGQSVKAVSLNSPGGLVQEGMRMADEIHAQHLDVIVPEDAVCASACFLLFAAGEHKTVAPSARIGIHSATTTAGKGEDDGTGTMRMARYVAQLGVPASIVGRMVMTDSINIVWLSTPELYSMGANEPAPAAQSVPQKTVSTAAPTARVAHFFESVFGSEGSGFDPVQKVKEAPPPAKTVFSYYPSR